MVRTTIDLDPTVLDDLRQRARADGKSLGAAASILLARALKQPAPERHEPLKWHTSDGALVDLDDPDVLKDWAYGLNDDVDCD